MKDKSEASKLAMDFFKMVKVQFNVGVKVIRSDNGREFTSGPMKKFYAKHGIVHQASCVNTPQQNGRFERKHGHILNVARGLRFQANLPLEFWEECVLAAAYLINRTPSSILNGKTPYEFLFNTQPMYDNIKSFGCLCYVYKYQRQKDKFTSRSWRCIFVGYPFGNKGWKVYDLDSGELFVSRDVVFFEDILPYASQEKMDKTKAQNSEVCFALKHVANLEGLNETTKHNEEVQPSESNASDNSRPNMGHIATKHNPEIK